MAAAAQGQSAWMTRRDEPHLIPLVPAKAGTQGQNWMPAFAGMSGVLCQSILCTMH